MPSSRSMEALLFTLFYILFILFALGHYIVMMVKGKFEGLHRYWAFVICLTVIGPFLYFFFYKTKAFEGQEEQLKA